MNPIRPNLPPVVSPNAPLKAADAARIAAQKAFFDVALGKTPAAAPAQAIAQAPTRTAPPRTGAPVQRAAQAPAETPSRPLRPGSILDIRV